MAEESPAEREERLQRQEERLAKQHERLKEGHPSGGGGGGVGKGLAGIGAFLGEHKLIVFGVIGFAIVAYVFYAASKKSNSANTANNSAATGGNMCVDSSGNAAPCASMNPFALDQLTQQLNDIQRQLTTITTPPSPGNPPPAPPPPPAVTHAPGTFFVNPTSGVHHYVSTGKLTLQQIAALWGGSWQSISGIPDNQRLFGGSKSSSYKPPAGTVITVPGGSPTGTTTFIPLNAMANHSPQFSNLVLADRSVPMTDLSHPGISGGPMTRSDVGQTQHNVVPIFAGNGHMPVMAIHGSSMPPGIGLPDSNSIWNRGGPPGLSRFEPGPPPQRSQVNAKRG